MKNEHWRKWTRIAGCALLALIALVPSARACTVPVFRYGLDHWPADMFRLEVSPASATDPAIAKFLRNLGDDSPLNLKAVRLPASDAGSPSRLIAPHAEEKGMPPVWSGTLDNATLATLTNSPARQEIVYRLLSGESAVWVLVESGNQAEDDAAAKKVAKRMTFLESAAVLPKHDPTDPDSKIGPGPELKLKFSVLRVSRNDPAEAPFIAMIGGPKQLQTAGGTLLAPVFARGRVLGAWPAKDLEPEQVDEACLFLLGACSCQVKNINPGWDILLTVDWDAALRAIGYPSTTSTGPEKAVEIVTIRGGNSDNPGGHGGHGQLVAESPAVPISTTAKFAATALTFFLIAAGGLALQSGRAKS